MAVGFVGAGTFTSGTGAISPPLPSGIQAGDLLLCFTTTANQNTILSGTGWSLLPIFSGGATNAGNGGVSGAAGSLLFTAAGKIALGGGADVAPSWSDSGDHQIGVVCAYRGADVRSLTTAIPSAGNNLQDGGAATTTLSLPGTIGFLASQEQLAIYAVAQSLDLATSNTQTGTPTGPADATKRIDETVITGVGGGLTIFDSRIGGGGVTYTATLANACRWIACTIIIEASLLIPQACL